PSYILRGLSNKYASATGVDANTPFIVGASDGCLAHIGCGAFENGEVSLTIGTSGAMRMMGSRPAHDSKERIFNYLLSEGAYIAGGPVNNGGNVLEWFGRNLTGRPFNTSEDFTWFIKEAVSVPPGADGLIFLPY